MEETFKKSHEQLIDLVRWINMPMFIAKGIDVEKLKAEPGLIIKAREGEELGAWQPIPQARVDLILETFCKSHDKINP